jgi:hypothetical protein
VSLKPTEPNNQARLAELTTSAVTWHHAVENALGNALEHAMRAGDDLLAMRGLVPPGQWQAYLHANTDISERSARIYIQVAKRRAELSGRASAGPLSIAAALKYLQDSEGSRKKSAIKSKPKKSATSLDALGWWGGASPEQRRHFLDGVGAAGIWSALPTEWPSLLNEPKLPANTDAKPEIKEECSPSSDDAPDADVFDLMTSLIAADDDAVTVVLEAFSFKRFLRCMPPGWREELEAKISCHLSALQLVDLLERRLEHDGIDAPVRLQKIRKQIEQARPQIDLTAARMAGSA